MREKHPKKDLHFLGNNGFSNIGFIMFIFFIFIIDLIYALILIIWFRENRYYLYLSIGIFIMLGMVVFARLNEHIVEKIRINKKKKRKKKTRVKQLTALPPEIGNMSNLKRFELYENQLTAIPLEIGKLSSLKELDLRYNQLTAIPLEIGNLKNLKILHLSNN